MGREKLMYVIKYGCIYNKTYIHKIIIMFSLGHWQNNSL